MRISDWSSDVCSSDLEIVETVDAASFFAAPRHPYARQLLAAIPTFAKRGKPLSEPDASTASNAFSNPLAAPALNTGTQALLRVDKLSVAYTRKRGFLSRAAPPVEIVKDVSFELFPGETLALLGESGCGKTTTAKALLRLLAKRP